jgi:pilus assembly protein CpaE
MNKIQLIIIDSDSNARANIKEHFKSSSFISVNNDFSNLSEGYNYVINEKPDFVLIDISENTDEAIKIVEKISLHNKSCIIFVTAKDSSSETVIKAMRAGAREFITKPVSYEELDRAVEKFLFYINAENVSDAASKIFTVFSNKGGIGKTSIACNLAINLAEITGKKVALVDLNLQLGDVTTFLDINPSFDISYIITNLSRIDESFLLSTLEKYKDKELYILADPPYLEQAEEITAEQINTVLNMLKSTFSYIVIDTNSNFDSKTLSALDISDNILLVSMVNLPSIRNAQRCLDLFNRLGYGSDKVKIVVNRYIEDDEIKIEDVEDVLNLPVFWKIPNNYFTVMSSINRGVPVSKVNPISNVAKSYRELAAILSNVLLMRENKDSETAKTFWDYIKNHTLFKKIELFINRR